MNRKDRNLLAENLRHYVSGQITNFEFIDNTGLLDSSEDESVREFCKDFWNAYSDLKEHLNVGKHKITSENEIVVKRFILFLKSELEYEWKSEQRNFIKEIYNLLTLNFPVNKTKNAIEKNKLGEKEFWPFFKEEDYKNEILNPKYLSKNVCH
ncbi:hypothetical protein [Aureivirga sp. CE67]|uniref:hypothetical protein n=1 Tax=Aureivirga sp. CE67 TaxID=1788983 RepID=UPI0018CB266F|nr:hypothetical protein [Aureivirga sp. CE67]